MANKNIPKRKNSWGSFDPEAFIKAWQKAKTCQEAADALGMTRKGATQRANYLRKKGIPVKKFARSFYLGENLKKLQKLAQSLSPKTS